VFNVVRELLIAAVGEASVTCLHAERLDQILDAAAPTGRHLVIKSHAGSLDLDAWLAQHRVCRFISLRDPRDAAISMAQRFTAPLAHTARWLAEDCNRLLRLAPRDDTLLRYEDRFFENPATIEHLAYRLGLRPTADQVAALFARYRTDAVQSFAASLKDRPPDTVTLVNGIAMDPVTHILAPHIGDGRSGKWRDLPKPARPS
jgi:hypothetical protein